MSFSSPELFRKKKKKSKFETWSLFVQKKKKTSGRLRHEFTAYQVVFVN